MALSLAAIGLSVPPAGAAGMSIVVSPHAGLHSGESMHVTLAGFAAKSVVTVTECEAGTNFLGTCDPRHESFGTTDAAGGATMSLVAHRTFFTNDGLIDCAKAACVMFAAGNDFSKQATAPISFTTVGGPSASVAVTPSTGLVQYQVVQVHGKGFAPSAKARIGLTQCVASLRSCVVGLPANPSGGTGTFSAPFTVRRHLQNSTGTGTIDCAKAAGTCVLFAFGFDDFDYHATAPLAFKPSAPPPPAATIAASPTTHLPYYAHVTVTGRHWGPGDPVLLTECPASEPGPCFGLSADGLTVSPTGTIAIRTVVSRDVTDPFGNLTDCARTSSPCTLTAFDLFDGTTATVPVSFDPKAPIPPAPSITVTPAGPYKDGQKVTFSGKNFAPDARFSAFECITTTGPGFRDEICGGSNATKQVTDHHGNLHGTTVVHRSFGSAPIASNECAAAHTAHTTCTLTIVSEGNAQASKTLHFVTGHHSAEGASLGTPWRTAQGCAAATLYQPQWLLTVPRLVVSLVVPPTRCYP